jgi:hypothetical protein
MGTDRLIESAEHSSMLHLKYSKAAVLMAGNVEPGISDLCHTHWIEGGLGLGYQGGNRTVQSNLFVPLMLDSREWSICQK